MIKKLAQREAGRIVRRIRAGRKGWSKEKDREYHDGLFTRQDFNPFTFEYIGYITIRRFADLASPFLKDARTVIDLGCGPAEITCELARRHPQAHFTGVDHSLVGIEKARRNAQLLGLTNMVFIPGDAESYTPENPVDIVLMFDAFHHLSDPHGFVNRIQGYSPRLLLIEPRGDWAGRWRKDLDLDWLVLELDKIRSRLAYLYGESEIHLPTLSSGSSSRRRPSQPVENRYNLDDLKKILSGYGLKIRGTVSGLDVYPPGARKTGASREYFARLSYDLLSQIDDFLYEHNLDLLAKHWLICGEKGAPDEIREIPRKKPEWPSFEAGRGPYDVGYLSYDGPRTAAAGELLRVRLRQKNRSFRTWSSSHPEHPDLAGYHWLDRRGQVVIWEGERTSLPRSIQPDEECEVEMRIKTPGHPGRFLLEFDMVREGLAWSSEAGCLGFRFAFKIKPSK